MCQKERLHNDIKTYISAILVNLRKTGNIILLIKFAEFRKENYSFSFSQVSKN